jgi:hypothetical protein
MIAGGDGLTQISKVKGSRFASLIWDACCLLGSLGKGGTKTQRKNLIPSLTLPLQRGEDDLLGRLLMPVLFFVERDCKNPLNPPKGGDERGRMAYVWLQDNFT